MSSARVQAKSLILTWFDKREPTALQRGRFAADVDRFFDALAKRTNWCECISTLLDDKGAVEFSMKGNEWRARPSGKGLVVSSIVPGWAFGWQGTLKDDVASDALGWFGHYARQYIHRSNIAKVIMAVWERNGLVLQPFGIGGAYQRYSDAWPRPSNREIFARAERSCADMWCTYSATPRDSRSKWVSRNTLDPAIHQGVFHFLRAQSLMSAEFELEALVAYDCVLHALQYLDWNWAPGNPKRNRRDLVQALGLGQNAGDLAERIYFLRNQFVAHAGGWRWWDAAEYLEDDFNADANRLVSRTLRKAADIEPQHRRIDPAPADWGLWLEENFTQIWSAVWFRDSQ
ncbi:hypothetical protein [Peteryoungia ipomoeae]|uniref:Uncharacterized protein n=1 Tax=Peteryoungia ipomoeae TaxID=1210932 RepID=A0A4S8P5E9_9HYPH|nr:hypothetical protein [Peteryoungia ipomoeae]THV22939.1 hypothetical protein FAA97_09890 [Peteryoungia ipomoeae]